MDKRFPGDRNLAHILKWYGWALYDVTTTLARVEPFSWDEIAGRDPADYYEVSHRYYLLPVPEVGETLKGAYAKSRKEYTFPILRIPKGERRFNIIAEKGFAEGDFECYYLNEFYFQEENLSTFCPIWGNYNDPSRVVLPAKETAEIFSRYFSIIKFIDGKVEFKELLKKYVD